MHDLFYQRAKVALDDVHSDTSVSLETTRQSLRELREHLNILIQAVEEDIRNRDR